jgi:hypothetical protein
MSFQWPVDLGQRTRRKASVASNQRLLSPQRFRDMLKGEQTQVASQSSMSRRSFMTPVATTTVVPVIRGSPASAAPPHHAHSDEVLARREGSSIDAPHYPFFNAQEAEFIEAACERLIPADEIGPGALDAWVPNYLDKQLGEPCAAKFPALHTCEVHDSGFFGRHLLILLRAEGNLARPRGSYPGGILVRRMNPADAQPLPADGNEANRLRLLQLRLASGARRRNRIRRPRRSVSSTVTLNQLRRSSCRIKRARHETSVSSISPARRSCCSTCGTPGSLRQ